MNTNTILAALVGLGCAALLSGCAKEGPAYNTKSALEGVVPVERTSPAPVVPPKAITIGLIISDATEVSLGSLTTTQQTMGSNSAEYIRRASAFYDPNRYVATVVEMLKARFARVELIADMNAASSLQRPALACVFDLRLVFRSDTAGQEGTATSELWFMGADGATQFSALGRAQATFSGSTDTRAQAAASMTVPTSAYRDAIEDMRVKLDQQLRSLMVLLDGPVPAAESAMTQFPKRQIGAVSGPLVTKALSQSEAELRKEIDNVGEAEVRYLSGERGSGFDMFDLGNALTLGISALRAKQQYDAARLARQRSGTSGTGRLDAESCQTLKQNADYCERQWGNMRSYNTAGGSGSKGSTGQAGSFKECYEVYSSAYDQRCR